MIAVGLVKMTDTLGMDWIHVVASTENGDITFEVLPDWDNGPSAGHARFIGERMAESHADMLVERFLVLGLEAERGEVELT